MIIDNDAFLDARVSTNLLDRAGPAAFVGTRKEPREHETDDD